jgi:hypothetical protein
MSPELTDFIKTLGFPVAVAAFVLIRLEGLLRQIRDDQRDFLAIMGGRRRRHDQYPRR